jgi:uncharacterized membrane protein
MDVIESTAWIMLGFIPTLCAMELAWRMKRAKRTIESSLSKQKEKVILVGGIPIGIPK